MSSLEFLNSESMNMVFSTDSPLLPKDEESGSTFKNAVAVVLPMMCLIFIVYKTEISCCKRLKNSKPQEKILRELIRFSAKD
uniref:Uncharacterized protein n=1 Tax=Romanomermis culicivorax TaxID=13658 RepID=A0A915IBH3_ROMCU